MATKILKILALSFLLGTLPIFSIAQAISKQDIILYTKKVDKQMSQGKLTHLSYPEKTCGGALDAYFDGDELVFMKSTSGGDQLEFDNFFYIRNARILKQIEMDYTVNPVTRKRKFVRRRTYWGTKPETPNRSDCSEQMISDLVKLKKTNSK